MVRTFLFTAACFVLVLIRYYLEGIQVARQARAIPLRIGVTGTRGKSSVTRLIAAALRGSGRPVVAKTTGSRPMLIHSDGTERLMDRPGAANILEQKKLLSLAHGEGASALVSEIMSIRPEIQAVESLRILDINICVLTNVRVDHASEQGAERSDVARSLSTSIPRGGIVFCSEGEDLPELREAAEKKGSVLKVAPKRLDAELRAQLPRLGYDEFEENLSLAVEVCRHIGLDARSSLLAMGSAIPDLGALRLWRWEDAGAGRSCVFVNAFAANDIESTRVVIERSLSSIGADTRVVGILNLREDRGERTTQWIQALRGGLLDRMTALYITGAHAGIVARRLRGLALHSISPRERRASEIVDRIVLENPGNLCLLGFGNIAGMGAEILEYCGKRGHPYEP